MGKKVWPRGVLDISLGREVQPGPSFPDPLKTNITDFPTLFKTEFQFLIPCLRHLTRNHTLCKTIIDIETLSYLIHCCVINGNFTGLVSMPKSMEVNINEQGLVKILLFIVQEKISV